MLWAQDTSHLHSTLAEYIRSMETDAIHPGDGLFPPDHYPTYAFDRSEQALRMLHDVGKLRGERLALARNRAHRCASAESEATCRLGRRLVIRLRLRLRLRLGRAGGLKARGYAKHRRSEPLLLLRQLDVVVDQTRCPQLVEQQCRVDLEQLARTLAQPVRVSRWLA